jgi:hypothetical protein
MGLALHSWIGWEDVTACCMLCLTVVECAETFCAQVSAHLQGKASSGAPLELTRQDGRLLHHTEW